MTAEDQNFSTEEWPELSEFKQRFRQFVAKCDWEQFHSPKNLAMALAGEAGELLELFQWITQEESRNLPDEARQAVAHEIADIQIYLATLADRLGIDIGPAVAEKMKLNAEKYPVDLARGNALKSCKLGDVAFRTLEDEIRIKQAQETFENLVRSNAVGSRTIALGFQGGALQADVHYLGRQDLWVGISDLANRYWIALGIGNPFIEDRSIVVEINSPKSGIDRRISGLFLADETGRTYLGHRGRVGGGRKGIGKQAFLAWYPNPCDPIKDGRKAGHAIVIGALYDPGLMDKLAEFTRQVAQFKAQAIRLER